MNSPTGKLVRDNIPEIVRAQGRQATTQTLDDAAYLQALITKLAEECAEFTAEPCLEELADIQEVVNALAGQIGGISALEKVRAAKAAERGAFKNRIFMELNTHTQG